MSPHDHDLDPDARDKASPTDGPSGKEGRLRVLFVEDHSDTRMSMEILLRRADHYVRSAETARAAAFKARAPAVTTRTIIGSPPERPALTEPATEFGDRARNAAPGQQYAGCECQRRRQ